MISRRSYLQFGATATALADMYDAVEQVRCACAFNDDFIPIVDRGNAWAVSLDVIRQPLPSITAADFVMNMEALGVRFWITKDSDGDDVLLQPKGYHLLPAHWIARAEALRVAFPVERDAEAIAFMRQRGDLAIGETPADDPFVSRMQRYLDEIAAFSLRLAAIPLDASPMQLDEMRNAFFAGAQHLFSSIMTVMDADREPTAADLRRLDQIDKELRNFIQDFELRHFPSKGSA